MKRSAEKATAAHYLRSTLFAAILALPALFTIGCSATNTVTMSVREPVVVTLPPGMETIGVIDRSNGSSDTGVREAIDRAFSLKSAELDRNGADAALEGLTVELQKNFRFRSVEQVEVPTAAIPASGVFPAVHTTTWPSSTNSTGTWRRPLNGPPSPGKTTATGMPCATSGHFATEGQGRSC